MSREERVQEALDRAPTTPVNMGLGHMRHETIRINDRYFLAGAVLKLRKELAETGAKLAEYVEEEIAHSEE